MLSGKELPRWTCGEATAVDLALKDKVALVTGGSRGLGRSVCLALAAEGARVAVNYHRSPEIAEGVVRDIQQRYGGRAVAAPGSVADESQIAALFDLVEQRLGPVEVLVNNAAVNPRSFVRDTTVEDWSATVQTNLTGTFLTCREMIRRQQADGRAGRIVNVASTAAYKRQ